MLDENIVWGCCMKMCMRMLHDDFIRMLHENVVCESWMRKLNEKVEWQYSLRMLYENVVWECCMRMLNEKEEWENFEIYNGPNIVIYFMIQSDGSLTHLVLEMLTHLKITNSHVFRDYLDKCRVNTDTPMPRDADVSKN